MLVNVYTEPLENKHTKNAILLHAPGITQFAYEDMHMRRRNAIHNRRERHTRHAVIYDYIVALDKSSHKYTNALMYDDGLRNNISLIYICIKHIKNHHNQDNLNSVKFVERSMR